MEPSKEAIAVRIARLNRMILNKVYGGSAKLNRKTIDREALLDSLTVLYDECNDDPIKKTDELVRAFVDRYRSTLADLRRTRVCISDFETIQTIGRGHFGEVFMVREKETGDVYAMKTLRKEQARKRTAGAEDERDVLAIANGPWVPKLQYAFQDNSNLYLVMELCNGGDLAGLLARRNTPLSEQDAAFYIAEVAHALKTLHALGYVHRDVKPHNILLDRCGHVKLGDFGSCARLSEGGACGVAPVGGTADYAAPELLAAADCAATHTVCLQYCRGIGIVDTAVSACDYWSLGVVAFELVTLRRPFSSGDDDTLPQILANIHKYSKSEDPRLPFPQPGPTEQWEALVSGLLRVTPARRYNYLDTLQHPALQHLSVHTIRDQPPPWVPCVRGAEDAAYFSPPPRGMPPPSAAPFRTRAPFAGQLPFIGFSYVAPEEPEDSSASFSSSLHDCTAINLATFRSAEKMAALRAREVASLQSKLAAAEAGAKAEAERVRSAAEAEAERMRARLQADITALTLQNRRLERQIEVDKEERMAVDRTNQELRSGVAERTDAELRAACARASALEAERAAMRTDLRRLEERLSELQAENARTLAQVDTAREQHKHYKDTIAKERALRRQTLGGSEAECREASARAVAAEANAASEARHRERLEAKQAAFEQEIVSLRRDLDDARREIVSVQTLLVEKQREASSSAEQLTEALKQVSDERQRVDELLSQIHALKHELAESVRRENAIEEQAVRTETRFKERLEAAEAQAATAIQHEVRHKEKVCQLEQLVRQLEREVSAVEARADSRSDTESVTDAPLANAQLAAYREQLDRAEAQLQAKSEEIAALRQEARTANLARWRKEREFNELSIEAKSTTRDLKRAEERLAVAIEGRKVAEQKLNTLQKELDTMKPQYERASKDVQRLKEKLEKLQKAHETAQAEVDRSRNDIRKLKSELQYSESRRLHAEQQEEMSSRERTQMRDELAVERARANDADQNNKALQEACGLLEDQLTDLEKLADIHELKNKELESETQRLRLELSACRERLAECERESATRGVEAGLATQKHQEATEQAHQAQAQIRLLEERAGRSTLRVLELETQCARLEEELESAQAALSGATRRLRALHEECAELRTRTHQHREHALQLQAQLDHANEEISASREANEAAAAWWRTRETKADATIRQQAKLIDFLQAKVEEAGRKKCTLSGKLFGRSGKRAGTSPPLRRANKELRDEVERLRSRLAASATNGDTYPPTPKREKTKASNEKVSNNIDTPDGLSIDSEIQIVWSDGRRETKREARACAGALQWEGGGGRFATLAPLAHHNAHLSREETDRAFIVKVPRGDREEVCSVVCKSANECDAWLAKLTSPPASLAYSPAELCSLAASPHAALYFAPDALAIGCEDGLHSIRGPIRVEGAEEEEDGGEMEQCVSCTACVSQRALLVCGGALTHVACHELASAARRAHVLRPTVGVHRVPLPDNITPHLIKTTSEDVLDGACVGVACGRRVFVLRYDAARSLFKISRSLTVDRSPTSILLTATTLYITGEKPLKVNLPSGALEAFGMDEPIIAAAARKRSPPKALLLIKSKPLELLICYSELGVFVDETGKKTRHEDPKWTASAQAWEYVRPFLYVIGDDRVTICHLTDETYRAPPCTCDTASLNSAASEIYMPDTYTYEAKEPALIGTTPGGVIIRARVDDGYKVVIVEGGAAFRSIGASVDSLATVSDAKSSTTDLAQSSDSPRDVSLESVDATSGFLADIRNRAKQLRTKQRRESRQQTSDEVIKQILTTEVGLKRPSNGRVSPETGSEFDSDSESEPRGDKCATDVCAEMFARQEHNY